VEGRRLVLAALRVTAAAAAAAAAMQGLTREAGKISLAEFFYRIGDVFKNQWQHIEELHSFNKKNNVPTTYFIGVNKGVGLSYSTAQSAFWIKKMI
jgi:hypothetical protein